VFEIAEIDYLEGENVFGMIASDFKFFQRNYHQMKLKKDRKKGKEKG